MRDFITELFYIFVRYIKSFGKGNTLNIELLRDLVKYRMNFTTKPVKHSYTLKQLLKRRKEFKNAHRYITINSYGRDILYHVKDVYTPYVVKRLTKIYPGKVFQNTSSSVKVEIFTLEEWETLQAEHRRINPAEGIDNNINHINHINDIYD